MAVVYQHIRKDTGDVFYVGIGSERERAYTKHSRNAHWNRIVNKVGYEVEIIYPDLTWNLAKQMEKHLIAAYGRNDLKTGTLVNMTEGGEGVVGRSEESNGKISKALKGRTSPRKGKILTEETKQKMREAAIKRGPRVWTQESREKMSKRVKKYWEEKK